MLSVHQINKKFGADIILTNVSFNITPRDRVGLIGPNGSGKTTLLRIIAGLERPDSGVITQTHPNLRIGYLSQGSIFAHEMSFGEFAIRQLNLSADIEKELERISLALSSNPENQELQLEYDHILQEIQQRPPIQPRAVLQALGLGNIPDDQPVVNLSGGQKTRLALASVIVSNPNLLLLDEPTNHLDINMLEWLEYWIHNFPGAVFIVSHDRTFLDRTVKRILDLNLHTHSIREYPGNYSDYISQFINEREKKMEAFRDQEYEIRKMRQDIVRTKRQASWVEQTTTSREPGVRRIAKKVARKAKSREKKLERYVESDERIEKPMQSWQMKLEFNQPNHQSQNVVILDNLRIGYPGHHPLVSDLNLAIHPGERIALTGENGGGKTTLLRTIAGLIKPLEGNVRIGPSVRLGYMAQEQEFLPFDRTSIEILQQIAPMNETEVRSFLHYYLFSGDDPTREVGSLSYGERSRLSLAVLVAQGSNLLLLDEPINHLDIPSRSRFEQSLSHFHGTILAVVHDRYFIERFATNVWILEDGQISQRTPDEINQNR